MSVARSLADDVGRSATVTVGGARPGCIRTKPLARSVTFPLSRASDAAAREPSGQQAAEQPGGQRPAGAGAAGLRPVGGGRRHLGLAEPVCELRKEVGKVEGELQQVHTAVTPGRVDCLAIEQ